MSHVVTITMQVRDGEAVRAACRRLGLAEPVLGTHPLFAGVASGLAVRLRGWRYPVVCQLGTGQVKFDNFQGNWGDQKELDAGVPALRTPKRASPPVLLRSNAQQVTGLRRR